jgi:transketolase
VNIFKENIIEICRLAGSGHPTSSLSSLHILSFLFFTNFFTTDWNDWANLDFDQFVLSKGHASILLYSIWKELGLISQTELNEYRKIQSNLEGHPTPRSKFVKFTTGSLGQGIGISCGIALSQKLHNKNSRTFVLCGDSELAEGSNWEALNFAVYHKLHNLIILVDVNRLGQRGETIEGWNLDKIKSKFESFGINTIICRSGHDFSQIENCFNKLRKDRVNCILFKTIKGNGIKKVANLNGFHGKVI